MIEAQVTLPVAVDESVHYYLERALCQDFGGFTVTEGTGAWMDFEGRVIREAVKLYTVAGMGGETSTEKLRGIINYLVSASGEEAIYWRGFDGVVRIVDCRR